MRLVKHLEQLLHLRTIVEQGSINRAARLIGLSQPALTRSIHRLEKSLGLRLLDRTARGVAPTVFGELLINHARSIDSELQRAADALQTLNGGGGGQFSCGGTIGALNSLFPSAVAALQREKPRLRIRVMEGIPSTLLAMVRVGELDVAVCARINDASEPDLVGEVLNTDEIGIFTRSGHPLVKRQSNRLADLIASERWILPSSSGGLYQLIGRELELLGLAMPARACETSSISMLRNLLATTDNIAITTAHTLSQDVKAGTLALVSGEWKWPKTQTIIYRRAASPPTSAVTAFTRLLRKSAGTR